jgi:hypothetical protein
MELNVHILTFIYVDISRPRVGALIHLGCGGKRVVMNKRPISPSREVPFIYLPELQAHLAPELGPTCRAPRVDDDAHPTATATKPHPSL